MQLMKGAPTRVLDPLQSVLSHLPSGLYSAYEGLFGFIWNDPAVPTEIKEALRFLSAVTIGCAYCKTLREEDASGERLLPDGFYEAALSGSEDPERHVEPSWRPVIVMAQEVLGDREISQATMDGARERLSDAQIVEALFFLLFVGASHRFSKALKIEEVCPVPTRLVSQTGTS